MTGPGSGSGGHRSRAGLRRRAAEVNPVIVRTLQGEIPGMCAHDRANLCRPAADSVTATRQDLNAGTDGTHR